MPTARKLTGLALLLSLPLGCSPPALPSSPSPAFQATYRCWSVKGDEQAYGETVISLERPSEDPRDAPNTANWRLTLRTIDPKLRGLFRVGGRYVLTIAPGGP